MASCCRHNRSQWKPINPDTHIRKCSPPENGPSFFANYYSFIRPLLFDSVLRCPTDNCWMDRHRHIAGRRKRSVEKKNNFSKGGFYLTKEKRRLQVRPSYHRSSKDIYYRAALDQPRSGFSRLWHVKTAFSIELSAWRFFIDTCLAYKWLERVSIIIGQAKIGILKSPITRLVAENISVSLRRDGKFRR